MEKGIGLFSLAAISLFLSLSVDTSSGNFFSMLEFTRDSVMDFSRGSERVVNIPTPKKTTRTVWKKTPIPKEPEKKSKRPSGGMICCFSIASRSDYKYTPVTETVTTYENKRRVYPQRSSPSNKFLRVADDINRAAANANASGIRYSSGTLAKLKALVERAARSQSYQYARQVLGQILYLLKSKPVLSGRKKRDSRREGSTFMAGLRRSLGEETFDSLMAVHGGVSLIFVIDDTGSMSDEIQATKNITIDIIRQARRNPIQNYILSPFNDPYPDDESRVITKSETETEEFVAAINELNANGGGDCPEYTFKGMKEAVEQDIEYESPMFVFTDAGPKDGRKEVIDDLLGAAEYYDMSINFFTSSQCDGSNLHSAFRQLTKATSGQDLPIKDPSELRKLKGLVEGALEGDVVVSSGSTKPTKRKRSLGPAADSRYRIPVDDSIKKMIVSVTTTRQTTRGQGISLTDPVGQIIMMRSRKVSLSRITVYEINWPKKGVWTLRVSGTNGVHSFFAKSIGVTNVDFKHHFLITVPRRGRQTVEVPSSRPVIGKLNNLGIFLIGSEKVDNSTLRLQLLTTEGNPISDVTLHQVELGYFTANISLPTSVREFKLKLKGTTRRGFPFKRISRQTIKPTTAVLRNNYASNDYTLPLGRITFVYFQLCNFGQTDYFNIVYVHDKMGYVISPKPGPRLNPKRVRKDRCVRISVQLEATRSKDVDKTDVLSITIKGTSTGVLLSQRVPLFVVS